ncbi:MAG: hypothetical protein AAB837_00170 [Patescibacteria group bacterium]
MEENTETKTKKYWYYLVAVLILAALVFGFYYFQKIQKKNDLLNQLPDYLLPQDGKAQVFKPESAAGYYLLKNQNLDEDGITYQISKSLNEAAKQVWEELRNDGWIAIGGSNQGDGFKTYKVAKEGQGNLFIKLEKIGENLTQVKIIGAEVKK